MSGQEQEAIDAATPADSESGLGADALFEQVYLRHKAKAGRQLKSDPELSSA
jgi:hypothetical protein